MGWIQYILMFLGICMVFDITRQFFRLYTIDKNILGAIDTFTFFGCCILAYNVF